VSHYAEQGLDFRACRGYIEFVRDKPAQGEFAVAITCPRCKRQYDITLFEFGRRVVCVCGEVVTAEGYFPPRGEKRKVGANAKNIEHARLIARQKMKRLRRAADRVCSLILISDYPEIDIEIEKARVRELAEELFPDRMDLYEMIYESRFRRLWEQFRSASDQSDSYDIWRERM